ncbi:MAG: MBL fold metallo-hydrolase [Acidobacteriota bacterium]
MFATTFLGHQGWMFHTERAAVLVDPLLCDEFGAAHALDYRVWPPRVFDFAQFPKLDAVVLSHEHDDHFDIPSLAKIDRRVPIWLSARSSNAAREVLAAMGFTVHALVPGVATRFGDLELVPFAGDHVAVNCGDEWDTLPFLVRSVDGHGSLFSMVDITLTERHVEWAAAKAMKPGLVSWTNNALDWSHMADYLKERVEGTQQTFVKMGVGHKLIATMWGTPQAMIMCAGGFSFVGDRTWLNQRVFCVDNDQVCALMGNVYKKEKFAAGVPGQTWILKAGKLAKVEDRTAWLATAPRDTWPSRAKAQVAVQDYAPATGRRGFEEVERLRARLDELAGNLVGGALFRNLMSLLASECDGKQATFAVVARTGDGRIVMEYDPAGCRFVEGGGECVAGLECWASDLLAVLEGELGPIGLTFGRAKVWNTLPGRLDFSIFEELHRVSHPLRRPAAYARTYARLWEACKETEVVIFGR